MPPYCVQKYYDFGVVNVIRTLFKDPLFCSLRGKGRDDSPDDLYGSDCAKDINTRSAGKFFQVSSSAYEIGYDGGQMFAFKIHSTGMAFLRWVPDAPLDFGVESALHKHAFTGGCLAVVEHALEGWGPCLEGGVE